MNKSFTYNDTYLFLVSGLLIFLVGLLSSIFFSGIAIFLVGLSMVSFGDRMKVLSKRLEEIEEIEKRNQEINDGSGKKD